MKISKGFSLHGGDLVKSMIIGSLLLLVAGSVFAQDSDRKYVPFTINDVLRQQTTSSPAKSSVDLNERLRSMSGAARFSQDYLLGPGDVVEVTVFGIEELKGKQLTLDSEGRISLPFINVVQLMGLTSRESEVKISALYEASVMKNPQVAISVKEYRSQFINVLGAVLKPGTYQLTRRSFLVDALAMAGGLLAEKAESTAFVNRAALTNSTPAEITAGVTPERIEVDLIQLLEKGDISLNVPIYAGDVITVPERVERFYYVLGDVNRGGAFEFKKGERITLSQALASAGGLLNTAKTSKAAIMRQQSDGSSQQIPVDVKKVLRGQSPDIELAQNDVVFVPGSTTRTISKGILGGIGNILAAFVYMGVR
ncbi:MAG: polysaccharide biosynthesis/export family protein [Acidobacteria bacterium]|nr:polysaccharide biosynthesis/export family protein [Acidobacteriota bacterium]